MVRYLIKFTKESSVKFIGHLDVMRTIQRMMRRSRLPVEYSKGFNPHINMSIAQPLPVGEYSSGDYMDVCFQEEVDEEKIKNKLNENSPEGIKISAVVKIEDRPNKKIFKSMAEVSAAKYVIKIKCLKSQGILENMKKLLEMDIWHALKKTKKGESNINIKNYIKYIVYELKDNKLIIETIISCGSRENLSAELMAKFIQNKIEASDKDAFIDIKREEMYGTVGDRLIPLVQLEKARIQEEKVEPVAGNIYRQK